MSDPTSPPDPLNPMELQASAKDLLALAENDRRAAEIAFGNLGFDRQLETALALQGDELHEWLLLSEDLTELVRALPPEHLHQAVRLIGEEDALDLLKAASSEQMQQLTDIEWFTEGKLDRKKVRRWIELLMTLNEDEADEALRGLDVNTLAQYLRRSVRPAVDKDNLLLALHLNQRYLFTPDDLETHDDLARRFLDYIYAVDRDLFGEVLALLIGEDSDIVEADMHAGREDRLLKRGFPALAEAEFLLELVDITEYGLNWPRVDITAGHLSEDEIAKQGGALQVESRAQAPFFLHALAWGRAANKVGERTEREFVRESAALANSLLLAHSKDAGNPELRSESLLAVQVLASVSLEALSFGRLPMAVDTLKAMELRELFRLGWTLTRGIAVRAWGVATDPRIEDLNLPRNLKWLPKSIRHAVLAAEDLMSWRRVAATARRDEKVDDEAVELLTWPRLCRLRHAVLIAEGTLDDRTRGREIEK